MHEITELINATMKTWDRSRNKNLSGQMIGPNNDQVAGFLLGLRCCQYWTKQNLHQRGLGKWDNNKSSSIHGLRDKPMCRF